MLRKVKELHGWSIHASDGDLGHVDEFYFDDEHWTVSYAVVDTGNWLPGREVLIATQSIACLDWANRAVTVDRTREQVAAAPGIETDLPVTRQWQANYHDYYGLPYYWGAGVYGMGVYPGIVVTPERPAVAGIPKEETGDSHLQSTTDITGRHIEALDGEIGHVEDFIIDDEDWMIRYVEICTRNWWPGKKILLAPRWIQHLGWGDNRVHVNLPREVIKQAPAYNHTMPITAQYESELDAYYSLYGH